MGAYSVVLYKKDLAHGFISASFLDIPPSRLKMQPNLFVLQCSADAYCIFVHIVMQSGQYCLHSEPSVVYMLLL